MLSWYWLDYLQKLLKSGEIIARLLSTALTTLA
jgi:hypothetical protein